MLRAVGHRKRGEGQRGDSGEVAAELVRLARRRRRRRAARDGEALLAPAAPSTSPDDDRSRWREQCLAIAGGAEAPAPPRESHELGGYFS